jgi:DNA repair ATPase RecN
MTDTGLTRYSAYVEPGNFTPRIRVDDHGALCLYSGAQSLLAAKDRLISEMENAALRTVGQMQEDLKALADLRGKLADRMERYDKLQDKCIDWGNQLIEVRQQLEAERARVREISERAETVVRSWWVYMAAETDTERDEAYEMMSYAIAALPASVDAKGGAP